MLLFEITKGKTTVSRYHSFIQLLKIVYTIALDSHKPKFGEALISTLIRRSDCRASETLSRLTYRGNMFLVTCSEKKKPTSHISAFLVGK